VGKDSSFEYYGQINNDGIIGYVENEVSTDEFGIIKRFIFNPFKENYPLVSLFHLRWEGTSNVFRIAEYH
jgi:hypothetical protein